MKHLLIVLMACAVLSTSVAAQEGQLAQPDTISQARSADPFKIARGSIFSASTGQPLAAAKPFRPNEPAASRLASDFVEAMGLIADRYAGPNASNIAAQTKSAISGMLNSLDPHSNYFDPAEFGALLEEQRSEYSGIGATITNFRSGRRLATYVLESNPAGPAAAAGLKYGDRIVAVNGEEMDGKTSAFVRDKIRGVSGTTVRLTIDRAGETSTKTFNVSRATLFQPSIPRVFALDGNVGYIDLTGGFNFTTAEELNAAMKVLKGAGVSSLIIDLRGNPGGILEQAVKVAETFLPAGRVIVTQRGRSTGDARTLKSTNRHPVSMPLIVLVNGDSASASEIVAGALQDHDRALIVGEKTFGKGLVQNVISLPFGAGLTLTTAKYFTPSGRSIQRDYSGGSLYDYYTRKAPTTGISVARPRAVTDGRRTVFGGDGIMPDEIVAALQLSDAENLLADPIFQFSRELAANASRPGSVSTADTFGTEAGGNASNLTSSEVFTSFKAFTQREFPGQFTSGILEANKPFIDLRLRNQLLLALEQPDAAAKLLVENDPEVIAALKLVPKAARMAKGSERAGTK